MDIVKWIVRQFTVGFAISDLHCIRTIIDCVNMPGFINREVTWIVRLVLLVAGLSLSLASASELKVTVLDIGGNPVPDVAVYLQVSRPEDLPAPPEFAVMDQVDRRFDPHVLVVQSGTEVRFPNSDVVAHHVYSFSNPNDFILPLYKGNAHPPVTFEDTGVVILGCNIHDQMLGYILVVDSHIFAKTDKNGIAILPIEEHYADAVSIWSPRINPKGEVLSQEILDEQKGELVFQLNGRLRPPHTSKSEALKWSDY